MLMVNSKSGFGELTDAEILAEVAAGDIDAYGKIVGRYRGRLYNFVFRFVSEKETAEDIVQETFLRAFRKRKEYKAIANFSTWLFTIAGNLAKSELRRRKRWRLFSLHRDDESDTGMELPDETYRPDKVAESSLADDQIHDAIASLPENYRQVILLRDVEGMSYQEIAEIVDCPVGTVKSRVNRARLKLQQKLKNEGRDVGLEV
ncbi:MAG: sigma-70 family RNA polymerase sigma factor [Candidatus Latescibacteria bacterium]|mgnify:FL=1|jgi:RNA polymerase sigma-70 factor (ECF subfamily)|nr:sigma-70 family RNA polymerase sigma factor [Candidatus Latescibacterota bacterium]MBT4136688.1 sigma-70 family RNA polymerase sigma factor [Candidatus Latescibacterota bacterium]